MSDFENGGTEVQKNRKRTYNKMDKAKISAMLTDHESKIARISELDTFAEHLEMVKDSALDVSNRLESLQVSFS